MKASARLRAPLRLSPGPRRDDAVPVLAQVFGPEQCQIDMPPHPHVLEPVVQDDQPGVEFALRHPARAHAVGIDDHMRLLMVAREHQRFVPCLFGPGPRKDDVGELFRLGAVSTGEQNPFQPPAFGPAEQPVRHRGLARAAPADIAHGNGRNRRSPTAHEAALVQLLAHTHDPTVNPAARLEHG